jgi:DNA (cytosine-5)-methyltransferase 1
MQATLFEAENLIVERRKSKPLHLPGRNGAKDAISRYAGLRQQLDRDKIFNGNWSEVDTANMPDSKCSITFVDLFSGAGGMSVGASMAGLKKIGSVEIDPDASSTIRKNFPESTHFEMPIEKLTEAMLDKALSGKKINIVFGGPPCQGFSVAGLRKPSDPRNKLFHEYIRVVKHLKPEFVVMENVPGILTMERGRVYQEIVRQFAEAGYPDMTVRILESATFGVPQLRTRAIFIANRIGLKNPYPKPIFNRENYRTIESAIEDLKHIPRFGVPNHEWTQHSEEFEKRIAQVPHGGSLYDTFRDAFKRQYQGVPSMTVKENHGGCHIHYELHRVLSAREMARLQTFPDDFIFTGRFKRVYWQVGNAVPCLMAKHIALAVKDVFLMNGLV